MIIGIKFILTTMFVIFIFWISKILFKNTFFSPLGVYGSIWVLLIGLYQSGIIEFYPLSSEGKIAIYGSFVSFLLGTITIGLFELSSNQNKNITVRKTWLINKKHLEYIIWVTGVFGSLGVVYFFLVTIESLGGVEKQNFWLLRVSLLKNQVQIETSLMHYFIYFNSVNAVLGGFYIGKYSKKFIPAYFGLIGALINGLIWLSRFSFIHILLLYFVSYYLTRKTMYKTSVTVSKSLIFKGCLIIFSILFLSSIFIRLRSPMILENEYNQITYSKIQLPLDIFLLIHYFVPNIVAFNIFLNQFDNTYQYGKCIFFPISKLLYKLGLLTELPQVSRFEPVSTPILINTFTYLRPIYTDFGILGCFIVPYVISIITSLIFLKFLKKPSLIKLVILCFMYEMLFFSFISNMFCSMSWWYPFIISIFICLLLERNVFYVLKYHFSILKS